MVSGSCSNNVALAFQIPTQRHKQNFTMYVWGTLNRMRAASVPLSTRVIRPKCLNSTCEFQLKRVKFKVDIQLAIFTFPQTFNASTAISFQDSDFLDVSRSSRSWDVSLKRVLQAYYFVKWQKVHLTLQWQNIKNCLRVFCDFVIYIVQQSCQDNLTQAKCTK